MCGLAGLAGHPASVEEMLDALAHRGPDGRGVTEVGGAVLGHVRLSIIDPTEASAQPFRRGDVTLTYNGELWNYRELRTELASFGEAFATDGDTEVVAAALSRWGDAALERMEGMWALAWHDGDGVHLARDRFGEVPLHVARSPDGWAWASEIKGLAAAGLAAAATMLPPGETWTLEPTARRRRWYEAPGGELQVDRDEAAGLLRAALGAGAAERAAACDVPACTLLSGGVDSSAVAVHLAAAGVEVAYVAKLGTGGRDVRCARRVADDLGLKLIEVSVPPPTADDLARVVAEIEMPHKAQVEIGWACLHLADAMRSDGFKVTYSGEGSDELWASYGMSYHGIKAKGWRRHREETFIGQHRKNFARCNKVFMARSVEVRLPFLHTPLVELALRLPERAVADGRRRPKAVLEDAYAGLLPEEVLSRPKLAFQEEGFKAAAAAAVSDPARFYRAEFDRTYGCRP